MWVYVLLDSTRLAGFYPQPVASDAIGLDQVKQILARNKYTPVVDQRQIALTKALQLKLGLVLRTGDDCVEQQIKTGDLVYIINADNKPEKLSAAAQLTDEQIRNLDFKFFCVIAGL